MADLSTEVKHANESLDSPVSSRRSSRSSTSSRASSAPQRSSPPPPTNSSVTVSIFSPGLSLGRRFALVSAALAVNLALPFVNGVMVGLGEIFARTFIVPRLGFLSQALSLSPLPSLLPPPGARRRGAKPADETEAAAADAYASQEVAMRRVAASNAWA